MEPNTGTDLEMGRRRMLGVTGGIAAAATLPLSGCLGGDSELSYRNWMPASFDPSGMYVDVSVVRENTSLFDSGEGSTQYGLGFDDISDIVGTSDAEVLQTKEGAEPEVTGEELTEYAGFTIYDSSGPGFVGSDGENIIESSKRYAITSVIDANAGEIPRLHEENSTFADVTSAAGEGDLVIVPSPSARTAEAGIEAKSAVFQDEGVDVTYAVEVAEAGASEVQESTGSIEGVSVEETSERSSGEVLVMSLDVETGRLLEFFGLGA